MWEHFKGLSDTRQQHKVEHNLLEVIIMLVCAVTAGSESSVQIEMYCKTKEQMFKEKIGLKLENGVPSHDTFDRISQMLAPKEFQRCFNNWVNEIKSVIDKEIVSLDGKTLCGSRDNHKKAIHMVSAWANENKLVLGQIKTEEESNEITAIPQLLDMLEVKGCIITIDAMGCQLEIVKKITEREADYTIGLKGNQSTLHDDVKLWFADNLKDDYTRTYDLEHGRRETREYYLCTDINWLEQRKDWANLNGIGMVKSTVVGKKNEKKTEETRYFITSLTDVKLFAKSVREHWGIENSLHWVLDVVYKEDNSRIRKDYSAENFAVIRHMSLNLLRLDKNSKMSLKVKRHKCTYDDDYLCRILFN